MSFDFVEHLFALPYAFFQQRTTRRSDDAHEQSERDSRAAHDGRAVGPARWRHGQRVLRAAARRVAPSSALVALGIAVLQVVAYLDSRRSATPT